jgi:hypothetical protein
LKIFFLAGYDVSENESDDMERHKVNVPAYLYAISLGTPLRWLESQILELKADLAVFSKAVTATKP